MKQLHFKTPLTVVLFAVCFSCQENRKKPVTIRPEQAVTNEKDTGEKEDPKRILDAKPTFDAKRIRDPKGLLTDTQKEKLYLITERLEKEVGPQIGLALMDSLGGKNINQASIELAEKMELGRKGFMDGILILIAVKDRKVRIEVGRGLERIVKDEYASRIIKKNMASELRKRNYFQGLSNAVFALDSLIRKNRNFIGKPI